MTSESSSGDRKPDEPQRADRLDAGQEGRTLPAKLPDQELESQEELEELVERIELMPPEQREQLIATFHSGPLPPPEQLEQYGRVVNGGAERIVQMVEREQAHRLEMQRMAQEHQLESATQLQAHRIQIERELVADRRHLDRSGQRNGSLITGLAVAGAIGLAAIGVSTGSITAILGLPLVSLLAIIVLGRTAKEPKEREERKEADDNGRG